MILFFKHDAEKLVINTDVKEYCSNFQEGDKIKIKEKGHTFINLATLEDLIKLFTTVTSNGYKSGGKWLQDLEAFKSDYEKFIKNYKKIAAQDDENF